MINLAPEDLIWTPNPKWVVGSLIGGGQEPNILAENIQIGPVIPEELCDGESVFLSTSWWNKGMVGRDEVDLSVRERIYIRTRESRGICVRSRDEYFENNPYQNILIFLQNIKKKKF